MRHALIVLASLLLATPALAQRDGLYEVSGTNLDGTTYTGLAQIQAMGLTSFAIRWRIGDQVTDGVGMASGRTIAVAYGLAQQPGMGVYTLNPDGSMEGEWTIIGAPNTGRERLVPRPTPPGAEAAPGTPAAPDDSGAPAAPATPPAPAPATPAPTAPERR